MDPLSVVASIVGILGAAAQVSASVSTLIEKSRKAPKNIRKVKDEVDTIRSVLHQLEALLLGSSRTNRARASLILVDQVVVTLSACVSTFSELDVIVGTLVSDEKLGLMDRLRWATKASAIDECLKNLQTQKSSLILMLTILTCQSSYKAEDSVTHLAGLVENILSGHEKLAQRLSSFEKTVARAVDTQTQTDNARLSAIGSIKRNQFGFVFEEELNGTWVYRRAARKIDGSSSIISSAGRTASWSMLTGLSLSDISNIAVLALPIYAEEISNRELYQFGEIDIDALTTVVEQTSNVMGSTRLGKLASTRLRRSSSVKAAIEADLGPNPIFGVPLLSSMEVACVPISVVQRDGKIFISGYVPTVVARCCAYIKEEGLKSKDIFFKSGSAVRIQELHNVFSSVSWNQAYGREVTWDTYQVDDAASLLLRYLKLLPEPIIPYNCYKNFTSIYEELILARDTNGEYDWTQLDAQTQSRFHLALEKTPEVNRHLLLYLLDLLQACVRHSNHNLMTSDRLVAVFQPSLLSLRPDEMSIEEHQIAHQVMVFMIEVLDEGQLREIMSIKGAETRKRPPSNATAILQNQDDSAAFENPRTLSKSDELSRDSKAEKRTSVVVKDQGKTKEGDTVLLNSGAFSIYPGLTSPGTFTNPREVQIPESEASQKGRSLGGEPVRITELEQEYSAHGQQKGSETLRGEFI